MVVDSAKSSGFAPTLTRWPTYYPVAIWNFVRSNFSYASLVQKSVRVVLLVCFPDFLVIFVSPNAVDFGVPQERKRVFFVGYRSDLGIAPNLPSGYILERPATLRDAIGDLVDNAIPALPNNQTNGDACALPNHEYMIGGFSTIFMSRNRVRSWDEPSFTIQAGGRHAPIHPQAPKMEFVEQNKRIFVPGSEKLYRRLSVRECARIQTFPDDFIFYYRNVSAGYKMIGNAVAVKMAEALARAIKKDFLKHRITNDYIANTKWGSPTNSKQRQSVRSL